MAAKPGKKYRMPRAVYNGSRKDPDTDTWYHSYTIDEPITFTMVYGDKLNHEKEMTNCIVIVTSKRTDGITVSMPYPGYSGHVARWVPVGMGANNGDHRKLMFLLGYFVKNTIAQHI